MHMCLLFDYGLVSPVTVFHVMEKLQDLIQNNPDINKQLQESWQLQKAHWNAVDQKPVVDLSESVKSPGIGGNVGDSGQRRKPNSEKKLTPKKSNSSINGVDKRMRQPDARRRLSLPSKPELRRKVLKESTGSAPAPFRRRSVNIDPPATKKKPETERN
uniref:Polycomb protein Su(Z)12 n=2 Tax=Lygus hesperus TaxID=30085 RepID=A0A0A9ZFU8_LYGHE